VSPGRVNIAELSGTAVVVLVVNAGFDLIHLYTQEQIGENLAIYTKRGHHEDERRSQDTFDLVFMSKRLD
jgi:hypothetical protein